MKIQDSIERFGTVYLATDMMKTAIVVEAGKIDLDFWFNMLPTHLHATTVEVLKEVFEPLKKVKEPCNDLFKTQLISKIQEAFDSRLRDGKIPDSKQMAKSWWKSLIENGGAIRR